jgi:hypothetical protein
VQAATQDDFLMRSTGDLVDLCAAPQSDPMYTAAVNFCHGFALGVFRVLQEEDAARKAGHLFCLPETTPTRSEAIARFVQWAQADQSRSALSPADGIATYLSQQFSCPRRR